MKNDSESIPPVSQTPNIELNTKSTFKKINENSHLSGRIRSRNEDFQVDEIQQFTPSGVGEHVWLKIRKAGENTDWVAKHLALIADVPRRDVSFAGMKDRNAITTQWFSVQMPGREAPAWQQALNERNLESVQVIEEHRHDRKLKRGALKGNQFKLTIREFQGTEDELAKSVQRIKDQGVPNYYGTQRFGHNGQNVEKAQKWFTGGFRVKDRNMRSIYLSAARSWIFNHILSARVIDGSWNQAVEGDVYILNGSNSSFSQSFESVSVVSDDDDLNENKITENTANENENNNENNEDAKSEIARRLENFDIHTSGALWGRGRLPTQQSIAELETKIANEFKPLCDGLEVNGLKQERRALRLAVNDLEYEMLDAETVVLKFSLPAGTYATTVLAELGEFK